MSPERSRQFLGLALLLFRDGEFPHATFALCRALDALRDEDEWSAVRWLATCEDLVRSRR